ncbi:MAG TPA: phosphoglycerate mutase family protein [Gaiellaceae bacterium]|nr:phosphoglycerate mutase family protein [Gaiellaceae bacterium]
MPLLLVRHAWAGSRDEWEGDDLLRPLDKRGRRQAQELVALLAEFRIEAILTSPAVRCLQTVEPLARARRLDLEVRLELREDRQHDEGVPLVTNVVRSDVVVCGHGGLERAVVDPPSWSKGAVFVVGADRRVERVLTA